MKRLSLLFGLLLTFIASSKSYKELSFEKLVEAANSDDVIAMSFLAESYEFGRGVTLDLDKAQKWYKKSAELNYASAQYNLAVMLLDESSLKQDLAQAFFWTEKAAEQSHVRAQFLLGSLYEQGKGTYENKQKAAKWYKFASEQNNSGAQYNLALLLLKGDGIKKDISQGMSWLKKAAQANNVDAKRVLELINNNATNTSQ